MSMRLAKQGRLIDRSKQIEFTFNGKRMQGYAGDSLASALLANDQMMMGRSFKYHRPRGVVASGSEEPNALMQLGTGDRYEPNQRATTTELFSGLSAQANHQPPHQSDDREKTEPGLLADGYWPWPWPRQAGSAPDEADVQAAPDQPGRQPYAQTGQAAFLRTLRKR